MNLTAYRLWPAPAPDGALTTASGSSWPWTPPAPPLPPLHFRPPALTLRASWRARQARPHPPLGWSAAWRSPLRSCPCRLQRAEAGGQGAPGAGVSGLVGGWGWRRRGPPTGPGRGLLHSGPSCPAPSHTSCHPPPRRRACGMCAKPNSAHNTVQVPCTRARTLYVGGALVHVAPARCQRPLRPPRLRVDAGHEPRARGKLLIVLL